MLLTTNWKKLPEMTVIALAGILNLVDQIDFAPGAVHTPRLLASFLSGLSPGANCGQVRRAFFAVYNAAAKNINHDDHPADKSSDVGSFSDN